MARPPWVWDQLPDEELLARLRRLAAWVGRIQVDYGEWLRLPPCWPLHASLREELILFFHWRLLIDQTAETPAEGLRWFRELRAAADGWRRIATCGHEAPMSYQLEFREREREATERFLARAVEERRR